jgi:FAD/FMN-containing dehydrogenase
VILSRRTLLRAGGAAGLTGAFLQPDPATDAAVPYPRGTNWPALAAGLDGSVELPGTDGYEQARRLTDPRFDTVRPPAVVRCAHSGDVAETLRFARRSRLPVVARGGGHSYVGASTSSTGLVLDLRRLDAVTFHAGSRTAIIGGGARLIDVYNRLDAAGVAIASGSCGSVGISGITCGGGIGMASSAYGMTCDAVVTADVVTADGRHRTVHPGRDPDLFWALRGGGGGSFGVVVDWRMRTYPATTAGRFVLGYPWADAAAVAAGWQARLSAAPDEAWSTCQFAAGPDGGLSVRISGVVLDNDADDEVAALIRAIGRRPGTVTMSRRPHREIVHERAGCTDAASCAARATQLVGSEIFRHALPAGAIEALLATVERRARQRRPGIAKFKRMTGAQGRVAVDATAFPWRGVHTMLQWLVEPATGDPASVRDGYAWIQAGHRAMARWSAGRYVNYLEPGPVDGFRYHGAHLARLRRIRAAVDPHRLFRPAYRI